MRAEELLEAIGNIHSETVERNMRYPERGFRFGKMQKAAACFAAAVVVLFGSSGIAYAGFPVFREFVNAIFYPKYRAEERIAIENGHLTGSFEKEDTLLTFLDKFNQKEWGNKITVKCENGYDYELYEETDGSLIAFVDSAEEGLVVAVTMRKLEYGDTDGLWQVEGYQVLSQADARSWKEELALYTEEGRGKVSDRAGSDSVITAAKREVLIYNVNDKDKIADVGEEDARRLLSILESYVYEQPGTVGLTPYVVKTETVSYLLDSKGHVIVSKGAIQGMFRLSEEDLDVVEGIFEKNQISLKDFLFQSDI